MSRKGNDTPSATRIRDNQRRSRNRRKELIEDLQKRVHEYELKGVTATQEVQKAARRVAEENAGLRDLLFLRGVSQGEIEDHLRSFRAQGSTHIHHSAILASKANSARENGPGYEISPGSAQYQTRPAVQVHMKNNVVQQQTPLLASAPAHQNFQVRESVQRQDAASQIQSLQKPCQTNDKPLSNPAPEEPECLNTADCFCPPSIPARYQTPESGFEISCEAAATIIVEMRGDGDTESARASLGCRGPEECTVKNSIVLQIMDEG